GAQAQEETLSLLAADAVQETLSIRAVDDRLSLVTALTVDEEATQRLLMRRTLSWSVDAEAQLLDDELTLLDGVHRHLRFSYDEAGRIIERDLLRDQQLIARARWRYEESAEDLPEGCQISRYQSGYLSGAVSEFGFDAGAGQVISSAALDRVEIRDDEADFDTYHLYSAGFWTADPEPGRCQGYQITAPELSFRGR
ncbi:MAG: hypothetical protein VYD19_06830, partial [Myxococcota bacterium]|nr:hypothetical protein [Myxococcota bacterium]